MLRIIPFYNINNYLLTLVVNLCHKIYLPLMLNLKILPKFFLLYLPCFFYSLYCNFQKILQNLADPSWWFTGTFFVVLGIILTKLLFSWIPKVWRKISIIRPALS